MDLREKLGHLPAISRKCGEIVNTRFTVDTHTKKSIVIDVKGKRKKEKFPTIAQTQVSAGTELVLWQRQQ